MYKKAVSELNPIRLGDYLEVLTDYHANGSYETLKKHVTLLDVPDYAVMIRTKNFENEKFHTDLKFISKSAYGFLSKSKVLPGDIIMNKIANAGSVYRMPDLQRPVSLAMNLFLLRIDDDRMDSKYAYYLMKKNEDYIKTFANGTATKTITKDAVRDLHFKVPKLPTQRRIGRLIECIEELIFTNDTKIRKLHQLGLDLYEHAFKDFEHRSLMSSPYWHFVKANASQYSGSKRYYATADIDGLNIVNAGLDYDFLNKPSRAQKEPRLNSVWFARMKDTYKIVFVSQGNEELADSSLISSGFAGFQATDETYFPFLFFTITSKEFERQKSRHATGATQMAINNEGLKNISTVSPGKELVIKFGKSTASIIHEILVLQKMNTLLREQKAILLDGLIPMQGARYEF